MPRDDIDSLTHVYAPSIFIGGRARTGTTLMQGLICNSPDTIGTTAESIYLRQLLVAFHLGYRSSHSRDYFDGIKDLVNLHRKLLELYLRHVDLRFGPGKILVQKAPTMTYYFPDLAVLMPKARFIVMMRDFRDIFASKVGYRVRRGDELTLENEIQKLIDLHEHIQEFRPFLKNRLLYVRYERLACCPEESLAEIASFLGISLTDDVAGATWTTKRRREDRSASALDGEPVSRSQVGAYRGVLDDDTLKRIEGMRPEITQRLGMDCFAADDPDDGDRFRNTELLV